jgi:hypothetical protein
MKPIKELTAKAASTRAYSNSYLFFSCVASSSCYMLQNKF